MERMKARMVHRGPDADGTWISEDGQVCLGHQRLAIVDLSEKGAQPMTSHSGRYVIVYNGEIYNTPVLRKRLLAEKKVEAFRGTSDTEILLEGIEAYGLEETLKICKGMFALAVYDTKERILQLARDRVGEKPLYYGFLSESLSRNLSESLSRNLSESLSRNLSESLSRNLSESLSGNFSGNLSGNLSGSQNESPNESGNAAGNGAKDSNGSSSKPFVFASDLGCIAELDGFSQPVATDVLDMYFTHGYIPAPFSIYEGIGKLIPGTILTIREPFTENDVTVSTYWSMQEAALNGKRNPFTGTRQEAADELERLIRDSVKGQMVADVPLGAFLSAGIDSSTIVALMQAQSTKKVRTFTIGMEDEKYNEAVYAAQIAQHLGTEHTEMYITEEDALKVVPLLPRMFSEPFADSSQIPTYLVSKMTRDHVTVSLSGGGGDELFCGYTSYASVERIWSKMRGVPAWIRRPASSLILHSPLTRNDMYRIKGKLLSAKDPEEVHILEQETDPLITRIALAQGNDYVRRQHTGDILGEVNKDCMLMDMTMYHPDDILVKVDRTAMAVSLETRIPLLDRDIVEFAWTLPLDYLRHSGYLSGQQSAEKDASFSEHAGDNSGGTIGKLVLRDVLYRYVPKEIMDRPKKGFGIPIRKWLRTGELREWAEGLIEPSKLRAQGYLDPEIVGKIWKDFTEKGIWREQIWYILMFQAWLESR